MSHWRRPAMLLIWSHASGAKRILKHMRGPAAWEFQCSVDCDAPAPFAWQYWTNVANWNDPPATFHLDGPFAVGARLTTSLPGQTLHSLITHVVNDSQATIEMQLEHAML